MWSNLISTLFPSSDWKLGNNIGDSYTTGQITGMLIVLAYLIATIFYVIYIAFSFYFCYQFGDSFPIGSN